MKTSQAIAHFGDRAKVAEALGIKPPSVYGWGTHPPLLRQLELERVTGGKLKAEAAADKYRFPAKVAA